MKKRETKSGRPPEHGQVTSVCICLLAFAVPFTILSVAFAAAHIYPFGNKQVLAIDAWHQYYPFLTELRRKIREGESLLYCWHLGMGSGFMPIIAYYLASPLNLLFVVSPEQLLRETFALMILLKIGAAGTACAWSFQKALGRPMYGSVIFSAFYALCGWALGYYWNLMWLDTFALFPLVVTGMAALIRDKKYRLYTLSLAASILFNYYIGLLVCIFTAVCFFALCVIWNHKARELWENFRNIVIFSGIAVLMCAVVILPTIVALQNTVSKADLPSGWNGLLKWVQTLAQTLSYTEPTVKLGLPNLYCGVLSILLLFVFYQLPAIAKREKIIYSALVLFLFASTNISLLDFAWHGFHKPNQIPYRYTFMLSFLLVLLACRAYAGLDTLEISGWKRAAAACAVYVLVTGAAKIYGTTQGQEAEDAPVWPLVWKNVLLAAVYLLLLLLLICKKIKKALFAICLAIAAGLELIPTAMAAPGVVSVSDRDSYPDKYEQIQKLLDGFEKEAADDDFYRIELARRYSRNPSMIYGYNGFAVFSSTVNAKMRDLFRQLGLVADDNGLWYYYQNSTPVNNTFLNLKYLISKGSEITNQEYLEQAGNADDVYAYRNTAYLPIGFMVEEAMAEFGFDGNTPFEKQNQLLKAAAGITEDVFEPVDIAYVSHENIDVTRWDYGTYSYQPSADADDREEKFSFTYLMPRDGSAYVYMDLNLHEARDATIEADGRSQNYEIDKANIFPAGTHQKGEGFTAEAKLDAGRSGDLNIYASILNEKVFDQAYELLKDEVLVVTESAAGKVKGTVVAKKDGLLYTSIPYEAGWNIYVDGKKADLTLIGDALMGVRLSAGEHTIEFRYAPLHVYLGALLSITGVGMFVFACFMDRKKRFIAGRSGWESSRKRKTVRRAAIGAAALLCFAAAVHMPAAAEQRQTTDRPVENGMYKLVSGINNGYVWDVHLASAEDGANLQLYEDNGSNAQKFDFVYVSDGYYTITNVNSKKAIGCFADELTDRVNLQQGSFAHADLQLWKLESRGDGYYSLICKGNGLAANAESDMAENGTNLQAYGPNQAAAQEFRLVRTEAKKGTAGGSQTAEHSKWFYYGLTFVLLGAETALIMGAAYVFGSVRGRKR